MWRVSEDKKRIEAVGTVGRVEVVGKRVEVAAGGSKEVEMADAEDTAGHSRDNADKSSPEEKLIKGVINDIAIFERGERGQDGLCIVAAVGTEHRLGRWQKVKGRNGAVVFEIPKVPKQSLQQEENS